MELSTAVSILATIITGLIGYFLKRTLDGVDTSIKKCMEAIEEIKKVQAAEDKAHAVADKEALIALNQRDREVGALRTEISDKFLSKHEYTREYVALSSRVDGLARRVDRLFEALSDSPTGKYRLALLRKHLESEDAPGDNE